MSVPVNKPSRLEQCQQFFIRAALATCAGEIAGRIVSALQSHTKLTPAAFAITAVAWVVLNEGVRLAQDALIKKLMDNPRAFALMRDNKNIQEYIVTFGQLVGDVAIITMTALTCMGLHTLSDTRTAQIAKGLGYSLCIGYLACIMQKASPKKNES